MSSALQMKQNPFNRPSPFLAQPSYSKPTNINTSYYNKPTYSYQQTLLIQTSTLKESNSYLKNSRLEDSMWKFHQDNCNKQKVFHNSRVGDKVDTKRFENQIILTGIKHNTTHKPTNQKVNTYQTEKPIQNPFGRKYLVPSNTQITSNIIQAPTYPMSSRVQPLKQNNYINPTSQTRIPLASSSLIPLSSHIYPTPQYNYNYEMGIQYNFNRGESPVKDRSMKAIQSKYSMEDKESRNYDYRDSKVQQYRDSKVQEYANSNLHDHNESSALQRDLFRYGIDHNSPPTRNSLPRQKEEENVKFAYSDQQEEDTPRYRADEHSIKLSKKQIQDFQSGPATLTINGKVFFKQQLQAY